MATDYGIAPWQGLNWGIGIAANFDVGGKRIKAVQLDNANIVRVTESGNVGVSFMLEAHYFFKELMPRPGCFGYNCNDVAWGPFVAIEVGGGSSATPSADDKLITGYALGMMIGLHHPTPPDTDSKFSNASWNFGVGLRVDPGVKVLADGVVANRPPPAGITITDLLIKKEARYGIMLLSSFSS